MRAALARKCLFEALCIFKCILITDFLAESSNRVGHERLVAFSHQAEHTEKSSQCAHSVSATTESKEIDGVAFLVLIHKEDIRVGEVIHQTRAEGQTALFDALSEAAQEVAARAQQDVLVERSIVAQKNAELRQAELIAEVVRPAEAEAERIRALARAQADATKLSAEAAAAQDRIALDQAIIQQLPEMLRAAAQGLQGANVTVLDGAEGLNSVVASLASQGVTILESIRNGMRNQVSTDVAQLNGNPADRVAPTA